MTKVQTAWKEAGQLAGGAAAVAVDKRQRQQPQPQGQDRQAGNGTAHAAAQQLRDAAAVAAPADVS